MSYVHPSATVPLPRQLSLVQFIQTVIAGVSEIPGDLVRPTWQIAPPQQPDVTVNWIGMGVTSLTPDANAYLGMNDAGVTSMQRHEQLEVACAIYGPAALETAELIRDGFQVPQNLESLRFANMGFVETSPPLHVPELINERWFNRYQMNVILRRETVRTYPILSVLSARGRIHTVVGDEEYLLAWATQS